MKENDKQQMNHNHEKQNEEMHQCMCDQMEHMHQKIHKHEEEEHMDKHECHGEMHEHMEEGHNGMHMEHGRYELNVPYPEVKVNDKNSRHARLLQDDYAGVVSELTAINQYSYHHLVTEDLDKEVTEAFAGIAVVEMMHFQLLGEAIIKLGGDPILTGTFSNMGQFWNGSYVKYSKTLRQILLDAIKSEQDAIVQYKRHISMIGDINIIQLLERIILDEQFHITIFNRLLKKITS